ncbi:MAG: C25 family cysteine peptidase, partial [Ignavibacteria bacterium]|nr:C25 family cysteine peptidase [Ignavibacteria bacterium]
MRKILFSLLVLVSIIGIKAEIPQGVSLSKSDRGYIVNFALPKFSLNTMKDGGMQFQSIDIANYGVTNDIGYPCLPQASFFLAIPADANTPVVKVLTQSENTMTLDSKVYPYQMPWVKNRPLSERPFSMNKDYYTSKGKKNEVLATVSEPFVIGGVKGVRITIYPFSYNPADNMLSYITSAQIEISVSGSKSYDGTHSAYYNQFLRDLFPNYRANDSKAAINYLIITAPEFESGLAPFVTFKSAQGYNVSVVTTSVAGTTTTAIKNFIQTKYNDPLQKPEYLLLVGDVDKIPNWTGTGSDTPPTDLNYGLLEGTDMFADVFTGRFSVTSATELSNIINKSIYMETNIATLTKKNVFMSSTDNYSITEGTHNYVISTYFAPQNYTNLKLYTQTYSATTAQLSAALNNNQIFAIYSGHGAETYWADGPVFYQTDVRALTNTVFPYVY